MLSYKKVYNIYNIKKEWFQLQNSGCLSSPFQTFEFMKRVWIYFYPYYIVERLYPLFYVFYNDEKCVLIMPLVKHIGQNKVELIGHPNGFEYCDVITSDTKYIKEALSILGKIYDRLVCYKVLEETCLWKMIGSCAEHHHVINNVCINYGNDYDTYNKSLSKSVRQNIRTAYNRLNTDCKSLKLNVLMGGGITLIINHF